MFPAAVKLSEVNKGCLGMDACAAANEFQSEETTPFCYKFQVMSL